MDIKEYRRQYYQRNKDKFNRSKEYARNYYLKNKDKISEYHREYYRKCYRFKAIRIGKYSGHEARKIKAELLGITASQLKLWGENSAIAMKRANRQCELCGKAEHLVIHHKDNNGMARIRRKEKPNNDVDNLMIVCKSCHYKVHNI